MNDDILDLAFALDGRAVMTDYADALWRGLSGLLPWLAAEEAAAVHPLAWVSPGEGELYLSRRSRLMLRLPRGRLEAARSLSGVRLDLGSPVTIGAATVKALMPARVLYSSFVTVGTADESAFLAACEAQLAVRGVRATLLCGKARRGAAAEGEWHGFSLMVHGLEEETSLRLQQEGLGGERKRGCGVFVPHKSIVAVSD